MPTGDPILDALDFTPETQQCECGGKCGNHPPGQRCPDAAQFHTRVHAFGFCQQPGLDHGFAIHLVCAGCLIHYARLAGHLVEASHRERERTNAYLRCGTCGTQLIDLHHIWEARELADVI